jgi:hypothetical protein
MVQELSKLFIRDLQKLQDEIEAFQEESNLWIVTGQVKNPSGNLCLHLVGNLNTYLGKNLGNTGYVRDRPAEFSRKAVPKSELTKMVKETSAMVQTVLSNLQNSDLQKRYPEDVLGYEMTTGYFFIHLYGHLSYHLGQINYLRRILE